MRRAWRSAQRLGAELDLLWCAARARRASAEEREQLEALRRLASVLGAHLLIEEGDDVAEVAIRVARERGTTYLLMGTPQPRSAWRRLTQPALPFSCCAGCRASTCGSSPTEPSGRRERRPRRGELAR